MPARKSSCAKFIVRCWSRSSNARCIRRPARWCRKPAWVVTTINSAELIKHASNSFLALKISYANMVADLAERLGADIEEVMRAVGMDPRIGPSFLRAGLGFGGFCLPKDLQAFVQLAERSGVDFSLLKEAERINKRRIDHFLEKVRRALWVVQGKAGGSAGTGVQGQYG